jgi:hypothetical protein
LAAFKRRGGSLTGDGALIGGGFGGSSIGGGVGGSCGGGGGSLTGGVGSSADAASMFFSRCAANISHAFAITSSERFASRSLKFWTSCRHRPAFRRYRSTNSVTRQVPNISKDAFYSQGAHKGFCSAGVHRSSSCGTAVTDVPPILLPRGAENGEGKAAALALLK